MGLATIRVDVAGAPYDVVVGPGASVGVIEAVADADRVGVVVDERVLELHGVELLERWAQAGALPRIHALAGGEGAKELEVLGEVLDFCADAELSRRSMLVALGGGSIGDLAGLAASLFKRGLDIVQLPSTLLAQVDASVGGKTAVNLASGKNLAGTFHQPRAVFCDTRLLATLPAEEFASGLGEVVKTALIGGEAVLSRLEERADAVARRDEGALAETIADCVRVKAEVVADDPGERGRRKTLNLGHTFAHGIEYAAGYGRVPHGVAVATGLALAAAAAERALGVEVDPMLRARVTALLGRFDLPASLAALADRYDLGQDLAKERLREGIGHDKKGSFGEPLFVLASAPGELRWGVRLDPGLLDDPDRVNLDVAQDGNLFPREDLLEAVARSDWRDQPVPTVAWLLTALGAFVLAAGLPVADRIVVEPSAASAAGAAPWLHPVHALAATVGRAGLGIEAAWFLISAAGLGGALLALRLALKAFGFDGRLALVAALTALAAPLCVSASRLPSDFMLGVCGASILLAAAAAPMDPGARGARGFGLRLGLAFSVAVLLRPDALALAPAVLVCAAARGAAARAAALWPSLAVLLGLAACAALRLDVPGGSAGFIHGRWIDLLLAGGALWWFAPLAWLRDPEEEPPPLWLGAWLAGGVGWAVLGGPLGLTTLASGLVPGLAVLFANVLARRARPDGAGRAAALAALVQGASLLAVGLVQPGSAPLESALTDSQGELRQGDVLVAAPGADEALVFLLRRRHGLTVFDASWTERIAEAQRDGRRLVALGEADARCPFIVSPGTGAVEPAEGR